MTHADLLTSPAIDLGLLVLRIVLGLYMAAHGAQKLFGWFGGHGLAGTAGFFEQIGFRPGHVFAMTAAGTELLGGILVAVGLLGPIGPALMLSVMIVAIESVHRPYGFFATQNGVEMPVLYAAGAFALALTGFGAFSLDAAVGLTSLWTGRLVAMVLAIGVLGGAFNLVIRRVSPAERTSPAAH
jgi:putative oxidoreductase